MSGFRSIVLLISLISTTTILAQFTDVINSNRPGKSMSAFSVGKTVFQAEAGIYGIDESHKYLNYESRGLGGELSLRYGAFFEQLEFVLDMQYQNDRYETVANEINRSGLKQFTLGAKFLLYDPNKNYDRKPNLYSWKANHAFSWREFIPSVAVYGGFNLEIGNNPFKFRHEEKFSPKGMIMTQNQFGKYVFVTNLIVDKIATNYMSYGYIVTLTRGFSPRWSGFIENQGTQSDYYTDGTFRGGAAYLLWENIQIDASIGKNIKDTPSTLTAGIGISWRFDENYEQEWTRAPDKKDDKDKDKKDKKAKKDKAKKRLDEVEGETKPE